MAAVAGLRELHAACRDGLSPLLTAIGGSLGPHQTATLYAVGNSVQRAHTGAEIARRLCDGRGVRGTVAVLFRELLQSADRDLGDGTARLALMAGAAIESGIRALRSGIHPQQLSERVERLRSELDSAFDAITEREYDLEDVARTSTLEPSVASQLVNAFRHAGDRGRVELLQGAEAAAQTRAHAGFVLDASPVEQDAPMALDDVHLLVADEKITDFKTLAPVIEGFANRRKSLIVAARAVEGSARALIERNRDAGIVSVTALVPRDQGIRAAVLLEDLAIATGAQLVSDRTGLTLNRLKPAMLGRAGRYQRQGQQVFLKGAVANEQHLELRLREIEQEIEGNRYLALDREHAERRRARLSGAWVELHLPAEAAHGGEASLEEARRTLTALGNARSGGVIAGAGAGLEAVARQVDTVTAGHSTDSIERSARQLVSAALRAPARQYRYNAGQSSPAGAGVHRQPMDPARLSRDLLALSLSFALRLLSVERAVTRTQGMRVSSTWRCESSNA